MNLKAILFDINGTLIDIETDEGRSRIYRTLSTFLAYRGVTIAPDDLQTRYGRILKAQQAASQEVHPEYDAEALWTTLLQGATGRDLSDMDTGLPRVLAELHRTLARNRLSLYPDVTDALATLAKQYPLGIVSDAQQAYAQPELNEVGLGSYFSTVIVSGTYGYRKPDPRLFTHALTALNVRPEEAIFVGNDMYHDVYGAQQAGLKTVFFPTQYGAKEYGTVAADYIIYRFGEMLAAVEFLVRQ